MKKVHVYFLIFIGLVIIAFMAFNQPAQQQAEVMIWPNPTHSYFTIRPSKVITNDAVYIKVFNVNGKQVYGAYGSANRDYRFGEDLIPGSYTAEIILNKVKKSYKLLKE